MKVELLRITKSSQKLVCASQSNRNLVDMIAALYGCAPLALDKKMVATFGDKRYEITRIK